MNMERSCGAVVFTRKDGTPLYLIVQEKHGSYSFPKGHVEGSETDMETACREIFEETGLKPVFLPGFCEEDEYDLSEKPGTRKHVVYFLAEYTKGVPVPRQGEIRGIRLLPYEGAMQYFAYENQRRVLAAAHAFLNRGDTHPLRPEGQ